MLRLVLDEVAASVGPDLGAFLSRFTLQRCASRFGFQDRSELVKSRVDGGLLNLALD